MPSNRLDGTTGTAPPEPVESLASRLQPVVGAPNPVAAIKPQAPRLSDRLSGLQGGKTGGRPAEDVPLLSARLSGLPQTGRQPTAAPQPPQPRLDARLAPLAEIADAREPLPPTVPPRPTARALGERLAELNQELRPPAPKADATIHFAEWLPDLPVHGNPGATVAKNVISKTGDSYGPFPSLSVYSSALTARAQGALSTTDDAGNVNIFAGDATKLYRLVSGSITWEDVSIVTNYTTGSDERWAFLKYGERIIATNKTDDPQSYVIGTSTDFAVLGGTPPKARYGAVIRDFVVFANTNDASDGDVPERVWWSAIGDPTDWPTIASADAAAKQSDNRNLFDTAGWIQGIVGGLGAADGAIIKERAIYTMNYVGSPTVFQILPVEGGRGTPAPGSIVQHGSSVFYLGDDLAFYQFDGVNSIPIGAGKVDQTLRDEIDQANLFRVSGAFDPVGATICWAIPGDGSSGGTPNKIYVFKLSTRRWTVGEPGDVEMLVPAQTFGQTLETLDSFGTLDTLPASLDSRIWTGGAGAFAGFDTDHKLNYFSGAPLEATMETGEVDADGLLLTIDGVRPIIDGGTVTAAVGHRNTPGGAVTFTTPTAPGPDGMCPQLVEARYNRFRVIIAAGGDWNHASHLEARMTTSGTR